jgi:hypothetical protein
MVIIAFRQLQVQIALKCGRGLYSVWAMNDSLPQRTADEFFARLAKLGLSSMDLARRLHRANPDTKARSFQVTISRYRTGDREIPTFAWMWLEDFEALVRLRDVVANGYKVSISDK